MKKFLISLNHAIRGLLYLLVHEQNFKIHLLCGSLALLLGLALNIEYFEFLIILNIIAFVFMAEIVNTIIENMLDLLHPEYHHKIKIIKDATAGVVLFAGIVSLIIGIVIFLPKIIIIAST